MIRALFSLFLLPLLYGCKPKLEVEIGPQGEVVAKPPLWSTAINDGVIMGAGVLSSVIYNGKVLCPGALAYKPPIGNFSRGAMNMLDTQTGKLLWNWQDYIETNDVLDLVFHYKKDNYLIANNGRISYCVDLETGRSVWRKTKRDGLSSAPDRKSAV